MSKPEPTTILATTAHGRAVSELRPATIKDHARELASRESDGIEVVLLWHPREDAVTLAVSDSRTGDYHPFAHAAWEDRRAS